MTVPNGPADIATFALSNTTNVSISEDTEVNGIVVYFSRDESLFHRRLIPATFTLSGTGITNNSGIAEFLFCDGPYKRARTNPFHEQCECRQCEYY